MPSFATNGGTRIFERLVLQSLQQQTTIASKRFEQRSIDAHEMHQLSAQPDMAMQPESTIHRVYHAVAASNELSALIPIDKLPQTLSASTGVWVMHNVRQFDGRQDADLLTGWSSRR